MAANTETHNYIPPVIIRAMKDFNLPIEHVQFAFEESPMSWFWYPNSHIIEVTINRDDNGGYNVVFQILINTKIKNDFHEYVYSEENITKILEIVSRCIGENTKWYSESHVGILEGKVHIP